MSIKAPTVNGVPSALFDTVAERVWPFLENFARRDLDGTMAEEIANDIRNADSQLWIVGDFQAVLVTRVTRDAVRLMMCAGVRRHEWQDAVDKEMREWARALGKKRIVALARPGWSAFGRDKGYREKHRQMVLELA